MKIHTTNYQNTFIEVAEDCPVHEAKVPQPRNGKETVASLQYWLIHDHPYVLTSDDVLFQVHAQRKELTEEELRKAREEFFSKGQPCMRASALTKKYGWGIHCNEKGRIALYPRESVAYQKFLSDPDLKKVRAMRSKR